MKLDIGVIMQKKSSKELLINGYSFSTKSGRILEGGLLKNLPSKGGLIREGGVIELLRQI